VTRAGQLLLGILPGGGPLRLRSAEAEKEARFAPNLWSAYSDILPDLLNSLTENCADAVRECFMNALIHADYDAGPVEIETDGERVLFSNPGLPRTRGTGGARNYRLLRMFGLAGALRDGAVRDGAAREMRARRGRPGFGEKRKSGLEIIRAYDENFRLRWDTLDLFTRAELRLEKIPVDNAAESEIFHNGWMPVVQEERGVSLEEASAEDSLLGLKRAAMPISRIVITPSDSEEAEAEAEEKLESAEVENEKTEIEGTEDEEVKEEVNEAEETEEAGEEDEYLDEDEETGFIPEFGSLEEMVRNTPRLRPSIVRGAILELCGQFRSLPELASALARSETSLRRHYISAMVREGLIEMEFPDRVGHPAQRYRTIARQEQ
jgi:hypothetical protein